MAVPFDFPVEGAENRHMLELRHVHKAFGKSIALEHIDLTFPPRSTTVIIGPSGCGKSTLLRIIVGLVVPDSGEVRLDDQPLHRGNWRSARRRMGYMIQDGGLFPHLTLQRNASLMADTLGWDGNKRDRRLGELAELVQLPPELLQRYPSQVSGGQRQRVALMRALFLDPDVLLLDEPMGALDVLIRAELQVELRSIFRRLKKTVILVTHDLAEAGFLADQIVLLNHGQCEQQGPLAELMQRPASPFVSEFIQAQRRMSEVRPTPA